jgi:hypothetical protein
MIMMISLVAWRKQFVEYIFLSGKIEHFNFIALYQPLFIHRTPWR